MAKDNIVMMVKVTAIVAGLITTLLTCGIAIGYVKSDVDHVGKAVDIMATTQKLQQQKITVIKEGVAEQKGRVDAKLESLKEGQERIETSQQTITRIVQGLKPQ